MPVIHYVVVAPPETVTEEEGPFTDLYWQDITRLLEGLKLDSSHVGVLRPNYLGY